jgi:pimeloyl-ACP methyl ester carboxylesterase
MNVKPIVFFIHGLNTFGDDLIHMGPLNFGPMVKAWKPALEEIGAEVYSLGEMGFGSIDEQVDRAMKQIHRILGAAGHDGPIHLLGHSMGGLVARGVAKRLSEDAPGRLKSVITIGSPHGGARVADYTADFHKRSPKLYRLMKLFGYDTLKKLDAVTPLKIEAIEEFNSRHPLPDGVDCVSLIGSAKPHQLGLHYKAIYRHLHEPGEASDGLVMSESQRWGRVAGEFELDHIGQLGTFALVNPFYRKKVRREFARAIKTVQDVIRTNSQIS